LPSPEQKRMDAEVEFLAPRDSLEQALADIWSKILGVKQVGVHDDFFESGGNSLLAVSMLLEVQKLTGMMLPLATLLQDSSIAALAAFLRENSGPSSRSCLMPIRGNGSKTALLLIQAAEGTMSLYRLLAQHLPRWACAWLAGAGSK